MKKFYDVDWVHFGWTNIIFAEYVFSIHQVETGSSNLSKRSTIYFSSLRFIADFLTIFK